MNQFHMALYQQSGIFQNGAVEGIAVEFRRIQFETGKCRRSMFPVDEIHHIAERTHHAVAAGRNLLRFPVHDVIDIFSGLQALRLFQLAETIAEPAHDQPRFKSKGFILPDAWYGMTVYPDPAAGIRRSICRVEFVLPETAAEDSRLIGPDSSYADGSQLAVSAAHHNRSPFFQPGLRRALFADSGDHGTAFHHRGKDVIPQAAFSGNGGIPAAALQVEDAGGGAVARLDGFLSGKFSDEPVIEHADGGCFLIDPGHLVFDPEQARQRAQSIGLPAPQIDLLFQFWIHPDQFTYFIVASGIHVGTGPDLFSFPVVEDNSLPHAGGRYRRYLLRADPGLFQDAADTAAGQFPVRYPVKVHTARIAGIFPVLPFLLDASDLCSVRIKQDRTHTSGPGIHRHEKRF